MQMAQLESTIMTSQIFFFKIWDRQNVLLTTKWKSSIGRYYSIKGIYYQSASAIVKAKL